MLCTCSVQPQYRADRNADTQLPAGFQHAVCVVTHGFLTALIHVASNCVYTDMYTWLPAARAPMCTRDFQLHTRCFHPTVRIHVVSNRIHVISNCACACAKWCLTDYVVLWCPTGDMLCPLLADQSTCISNCYIKNYYLIQQHGTRNGIVNPLLCDITPIPYVWYTPVVAYRES